MPSHLLNEFKPIHTRKYYLEEQIHCSYFFKELHLFREDHLELSGFQAW